MKNLFFVFFFVSSLVHGETFLDCEFVANTDYKDNGRRLTRDYYDREFPTSTLFENVYLQIDQTSKTLKFFPNDDMYSNFFYENNDGKNHNGTSNGEYHKIDYAENGNLIEWYFILMPFHYAYKWTHSLDKFKGKLKIQYEDLWMREYKCIKAASIF